MKRIEISGGKALYGTVSIQGSKNAVLPMIAAAILTDEKVTITNCPHIDDVYTMLNLMTEIAVSGLKTIYLKYGQIQI